MRALRAVSLLLGSFYKREFLTWCSSSKALNGGNIREVREESFVFSRTYIAH